MPRQTPIPALIESRRIAREGGCYVIEKVDRYLVYRKTAMRAVYLGFRTNPAALRSFVLRLVTTH